MNMASCWLKIFEMLEMDFLELEVVKKIFWEYLLRFYVGKEI
jgi:hypothetical protein